MLLYMVWGLTMSAKREIKMFKTDIEGMGQVLGQCLKIYIKAE